MINIENPALKLTLTIIGTVADVTALWFVVSHAIGQMRVPWWALLLFAFGTVVLITSKSPPGDFGIKSREVLLDIKSWGDVDGVHHDAATTYRVELIRCRKPKGCRTLIYPGYATAGTRLSTDVVSYSYTSTPTSLNPKGTDLNIDLGPSCKYGKKYTVISRCEYKDTFPSTQSENYQIHVSYPTRKLKIVVLLPANKPTSNAWVTKTVGSMTETDGTQPEISDNKRVVTWLKKRPDFNAKYQISWDW